RGASAPPTGISSAGDQDLLHPAAALARLDLDEALLLLAQVDHLLALRERRDDLPGVRRGGHDTDVADLRPQDVALVEDRSGLDLAAGRGLLGQRADVALQARVGADGAHDAVVVVGEAGRDDLALVRVRVAAERGGPTAAPPHAAQDPAQVEVGLARVALGRGHLDARAAVRQEHAGLRLLELDPAADGSADGARDRPAA